MLVRTEVVRGDGMHDDRLLSGHDMYDFAMKINGAGSESWLEPAATAYYDRPRELDPLDRDFSTLRWSRAWDAMTLDHFAAVWDLDPDDPDRPLIEHRHGFQRRLGHIPASTPRERWQRKRRALADSAVEASAVRHDRERRRAAGGSVEHAAPALAVHTPEWAKGLARASAEAGTTH